MKSRVVRISQVTGQIPPQEGQDPFKLAKDTIIDWLGRKIKTNIGEEGRSEHFLHNGPHEENAEFLTFNLKSSQKVWIMSFSHPCSEVKSRRWSTEAAIAENKDGGYFFGLRLNLIDSDLNNTAKIAYSTPNLLKELIRKIDLLVDGKKVISYADSIDMSITGASGQISDFIDHLKAPFRTLPVILVSQNNAGEEYIDSDKLAGRLAGIAHVYTISDSASRNLTNRMGQNLSAFNKAIRFYAPIDQEGKLQTSLYLADGSKHKSGFHVTEDLVRNSFFGALRKVTDEKEFPSFSAVKNFYFEHIQQTIQKDKETEGSSESSNLALISAQEQRISALISEANESFSLAAEEEAKRHRAEQRLQEALRELKEMKEQILNTPAISLLRKGALFPELDELAPWANEHFPEELVITKRAQKSALKSIYAEPNLIYKGLVCLAREFRNSVLFGEMSANNGGTRNLRRELNQKLEELTLEDRISIKKEHAGLYGDEYYTSHEGEKFFLDKHLAKGGTRDAKRCLRIYYTYDPDSTRIIVGHLPSHLTNQLT